MSRTTGLPSRAFNFVHTSRFMYCSSCIHSGPSTLTTSTPRRSCAGRAWAAIVAPTTLVHSAQIG